MGLVNDLEKAIEEVIGEATVFCVDDIAPIFEKYEALMLGEEADDKRGEV